MAATDIALLAIALMAIWALRELDIFARLRGMANRRRAVQVGGFSVGLIWGPALISALTGMFSGLAAISATNIAGVTNIGPRASLAIGIVFITLVGLSRMGGD